MRWHTRALTQAPPAATDDQCDQNDDGGTAGDGSAGKASAATSIVGSAPATASDDASSSDQSSAFAVSSASMELGQASTSTTSLDRKGKQGLHGRSGIGRSRSRDRQRAAAVAATSAALIEDEDEDIDDDEDDEDDEDDYDSYDYDPASGSDHALPDPPVPPVDDEDLDGPSPPSSLPGGGGGGAGAAVACSALTPEQTMDLPWRPQTKQSTCEFTHTIANYSQKRESGCKKAEYSNTTVDTFGNRWRLIVYVNGNGRASNHHLSLFLQVADADDLPFGWKKAVSYVLTLEHPSGSSLGYAKRNPDKTFKLCPKAIDWGWSQFITSDRIQQEGYISNDSLTVRASVTVKSSSVSIDAADAELYLKCAVEEGNAESVKACLAQGASVNCQFKDDLYTPLHTACSSSTSSGSLEVLNLLLEKGADGNACNKWRETPLLIAANNGHRAAVEALLDHGADPSLCSEAGWSALTFAAHKGYDQIVSLLLAAGAPVNCRVTEDLSTPLHKACAGGKPGHLSAVKQLLGGGADVHALNKWRETPLLTAANHGQAKSVEALLRSGADPCKCTDTGWSPLSIAAYKGHDEVVRILLEEGAPTEEADPTLSALLQAATKGLPDTVELLLRHGADHTVTTKKGDTALSILVEQNLIDAAVEMVTEYKASIPRCSRDRKKVQRARLLINLRVKQQQREGLLSGDTSDDDSGQDEEDEPGNSALHHSDHGGGSHKSAPGSPGKKKKKKGKSIASAEAEARAAELSLLQELEQEDQAKEEEAAALSKRAAKKKKKRDRERQQRQKEERERREQEERESKERERQQQKLKEERLKREREQRDRERRERELREAAEREEHLARMRKEKEEQEKQRQREQQEKKQREQEKRDRGKNDRIEKGKSADTAPPSPGKKREKAVKGKAKKQAPPEKVSGAAPAEASAKNVSSKPIPATPVAKPSPVKPSPTPVKKRGWETKQDPPQPVASSPTRQAQPQPQHATKLQPLSPPQQPPEPQRARKPIQQPQKRQQQQPQTNSHQSTRQAQQDQQQPQSASPPYLPSDLHRQQVTPPLTSPSQQVAAFASGVPHPALQAAFSVEEQLENMANGVVDFLDVDSSSNVASSSSPLNSLSSPQQGGSDGDRSMSAAITPGGGFADASVSSTPGSLHGTVEAQYTPVELPAVGLYRYEKVVELLRRGSQQLCSTTASPATSAASQPSASLPSVNEDTFRSSLYRWIARAAHGSSSYIDPIIPSWTESDILVTFLQRQFISESRRYTPSGLLNFELLKDSGATMADLCLALAKDVAQFRASHESQVPRDWSDASIGMTASDFVNSASGTRDLLIDWSGRAQIRVPAVVFMTLKNRYRGPPHRFLAAVFAVVKRYETRRVITYGTTLDKRLAPSTVSCVSRELGASIECWSEPMSVVGTNQFHGVFPDVDALFGGLEPFGKEGGSGMESSALLENGGSVVVMPPLENTTASLYVRSMVDALVGNTRPLSFAVVLPSECFHDLKAAPTIADMQTLDPRLGDAHHGRFVQQLEVLPPGQHAYFSGDGVGMAQISPSGSLFVLLQNEGGSQRFPFHDGAMASIVTSMSPGYAGTRGSDRSPSSTPVGFPGFIGDNHSVPPLSPASAGGAADFGGLLGGGFSGFKSEPVRSRRGRLFDLVDDGDDGGNEEDVVSDMLNLSSMLQSGPTQDIDIEAISLMGINRNRGMNGNAGGLSTGFK